MFTKVENNKPFVKLALEGFAGDGKTFTAAKIAIGLHKLIGSKKPIAVIDTEKAIDKIKEFFYEENIGLESNQSRTLNSLEKAIDMCSEEGYADILIIDSITHVWENFTESYKKEKQKKILGMKDWGILKPMWKEKFSNKLVDAKCHIIFTGRAAYEYEHEFDEETKKTEIIKSGIKMKAETETAFEPDILVLMQKVQKINIIDGQKNIVTLYRTATVLKDRTTLIDGKMFKNPTFEDFYPAIKRCLNGQLKEKYGEEIPDTFEDFETKYSENNRRRAKSVAEIEGTFNLMRLGTSVEHKGLKSAILKKVYGCTSLEVAGSLEVNKLEFGEVIIKKFSEKYLNYMHEIAESGLIVDMKHIESLLKEAIETYRAPKETTVTT